MRNVNRMDHDRKFVLHSNGTIDLSQVITANKNEKKKAARKRWAILAKALKSPTGSEPSSPTDEFSVRRISSFMLLSTHLLENTCLCAADHRVVEQIRKRTWYKYSMKIDDVEYFVNVGHRIRTFSAEDLMGFNNTGNICIWPSEETLTYYIGANLHITDGKSVLELGGGMSCLAGLMCAKYGAAKRVTVTDGNKISVENVQISLYNNEFACPISCSTLKWEECVVDEKFDVVFCADCLFFDEGRIHLIKCLWDVMSYDSLALVMAPRRGNTLENFIKQAEAKGFVCKQILNYNAVVWEKHLDLLDNCEADYWKSQDRKYCDFCKCWIADNKPSIEFHEKGRRHKENVSKRLKNIQKRTKRDEKETIRVDSVLQQMESAALEAYRKDMESNSDLTSIAANKRSGKHMWHEVRSQGGEVSYRNVITNEVVWKPPKEGFLTTIEQKLESFEVTKKQMKTVEKHQKLQGRLRWEELKKEEEEERARQAREKLKERKAEDLPEPVYAPLIPTGPANPYGAWQVVKTLEAQEQINWQLPKQEEYYAPVVVEEEPEPAPKFKEKTVESLGSGSATFKKRKFGGIGNRSTRQRLDDD